MAKGKYKLYVHIFPNGKRYVGITSQRLNDRWRNGKGYKNSQYLENALNKYRWEEVENIVLFENLTKEEAEAKEIEFIRKYKSNNRQYGYNIQNGGKTYGTLSQEIRTKISESKKGKLTGKENPFYGLEHTKATRKLLSKLKTGTKLSEETKNKIAESNKIKVIQLDLGNNIIKIWDSAKDAGTNLDIHNTSITAVCKGKRNTAGGFMWKYEGDLHG